MRKVHISAAALVLAVTTSAWAGIEPYPEAVQGESVSTATRAQVVGELREAQRLGLMTSGDGSFPNVASGEGTGNSSTVLGNGRELSVRIHAETIEAARLGLLGSGEGNPPIATAEQEKLIAAAGDHAVDDFQSAQRTLRTAGK